MKHLILVLPVLFLSFSTIAAENCEELSTNISTEEIGTQIPKELEGTVILVVRGIPSSFTVVGAMSIEEYKVVPRQRQLAVTKVTQMCRMNQGKLNRVAVLGGQGPTGHLRTKSDGVNAEVESQVSLVLGAQYTRQLNDTVSAGVQMQDNKTVMSVIGFDF